MPLVSVKRCAIGVKSVPCRDTWCHLEKIGPQPTIEADKTFVADDLDQSVNRPVVLVPKSSGAHARHLHLPSQNVKGIRQRLGY